MFDIEKFKTELSEAEAQNESVKLDGLQHAKSFLQPFIEIAEAANSVYHGKISISAPRPDGFAYSTTINVDGAHIVFTTQPGHEKFTIKGIDDELATAIPPDDKRTGLQAGLRQVTNGRSLRIQEIDQAVSAFANYLKWRLTTLRSW